MYEKIKERYLRYYITDAQLERYVMLGVITQEQADSIKAERDNKNVPIDPQGEEADDALDMAETADKISRERGDFEP